MNANQPAAGRALPALLLQGDERFQAEWEAGRKLTLEQALELAQE